MQDVLEPQKHGTWPNRKVVDGELVIGNHVCNAEDTNKIKVEFEKWLFRCHLSNCCSKFFLLMVASIFYTLRYTQSLAKST